MSKLTTEERFWAKVRKGEPDECWEWQAGKCPFGYGFFFDGVGDRRAHRYSWVLQNGPIEGGLFVLHRCDNPPCVNPRHLFLGTHQDNSDDKMAKGRGGHPSGDLTPPETRARGERHGRARITSADAAEIRGLYRDGATPTSLSKRYGLGRSTINHILKGHTWVHVR